VLEARGTWRDLTGAPYQPDAEWIGVVAQVPDPA
jgi:hypothetical protein